MSNLNLRRARLTGVALAVGCACVALPGAAQAATLDLGTGDSFAVLGGSEVTNSGPSVLFGDLGVSPGSGVSGFGAPATVNGAPHFTDSVAAGARADVKMPRRRGAGALRRLHEPEPRQPDVEVRRLQLQLRRPAHRAPRP